VFELGHWIGQLPIILGHPRAHPQRSSKETRPKKVVEAGQGGITGADVRNACNCLLPRLAYTTITAMAVLALDAARDESWPGSGVQVGWRGDALRQEEAEAGGMREAAEATLSFFCSTGLLCGLSSQQLCLSHLVAQSLQFAQLSMEAGFRVRDG
jgi:hypothetical protein